MALPEPTFKIDIKAHQDWNRFRKGQQPISPPVWLPQERKRLHEQRRAFRQARGSWSPQEAARQWLAFVERHEAQLATLRRKAGSLWEAPSVFPCRPLRIWLRFGVS